MEKKIRCFLRFNEREVLDNPGKVTHKVAESFALSEFEKYRIVQDKLFESDFDKFLIEMKNEGLKGAKVSNGLTIGIMPFNEPDKFSKYVDIPIITNMRSGRNYINALSSNLVIACGIDKGTISEISLSLVNTTKKQVIVVGAIEEANKLFKVLDSENVYIAKDYNECIDIFEKVFKGQSTNK